jgi:hypothetical protein
MVHPSMYCNFRGYLLLVLPESNENNTPRTVLFDDWLTREVDNHVNEIYYFAAEFDPVSYYENCLYISS